MRDPLGILVAVVLAVAVAGAIDGMAALAASDDEIIELAPVEFAPAPKQAQDCMRFDLETDAIRLFVARGK